MTHHQLDLLAVGDVVTDAFIKLLDDQAVIEKQQSGQFLVMPYGMKVPFDHAEVIDGVGNAANAAVACAKLGLNSGLVSNVGDDAWGRDMIAALHRNRVDVRFVHINPDKVSNYHYILWYKDDRTILIKHEDYDYRWPRFRPTDIPKWLYFSSISKSAIDEYHDEVADWLEEHPDVKFAFQPGTYQMEAGIERLGRLYKRSEIVILNREEAVIVFGGNHDDVNDLLERMHQAGCKTAIITDGPHGAYASDGQNRYSMPLYPDPAPPVERTGAGDAFASTLVAAMCKGESLETALLWAPINSMNVVQHVGAQAGLLSIEELEHYLSIAPDWYHPSRL